MTEPTPNQVSKKYRNSGVKIKNSVRKLVLAAALLGFESVHAQFNLSLTPGQQEVLIIGAVISKTMPDWLKVTKTNDLQTYVDPTSLRENGLERTVWAVHNHADFIGQNSDATSRLSLEQYHCQREEWRSLQEASYRDHFARGDAVSVSADPTEWKRIIPLSHQGVLFEYVCTRPVSRTVASFFRKPNLFLFLR